MVTQDELPMHHLGGRAVLAGSEPWLYPNWPCDLGLVYACRGRWPSWGHVKKWHEALETVPGTSMPHRERVPHGYKVPSILKDVDASKTSKNSAYNLCECCHSQTLSHVLGTQWWVPAKQSRSSQSSCSWQTRQWQRNSQLQNLGLHLQAPGWAAGESHRSHTNHRFTHPVYVYF